MIVLKSAIENTNYTKNKEEINDFNSEIGFRRDFEDETSAKVNICTEVTETTEFSLYIFCVFSVFSGTFQNLRR